MKLDQHFADAREDRIVPPALTAVAGAVIACERGAFFLGCVRQQLLDPLLDRRADKAVERPTVTHIARIENLAEAANNAGFRIGESSVQIENQRGQAMGHGLSFAER